MVVDYEQNRFAFRRAIGLFQAIKHKLVNIYVDLELARANAYYGTWAVTDDAPDLPVAAAATRVSTSEAFNHAARVNIQTHGGSRLQQIIFNQEKPNYAVPPNIFSISYGMAVLTLMTYATEEQK